MPRFEIGDKVQITECATYPKAVGRKGRVTNVIAGAQAQYELAMRGRPGNKMPTEFPEDALEFQNMAASVVQSQSG